MAEGRKPGRSVRGLRLGEMPMTIEPHMSQRVIDGLDADRSDIRRAAAITFEFVEHPAQPV